ncbi:anticodon nuclease [Formosa agariphila KMM 3901]|uniref:Anticodon nuclease n=1 Tax=Formosa agariphila (strain DSM 15362 / KCTC 12365 / LMG 23005 / KMM 3901 / M-2Alg 35-1) TaxID=1347342 RepID=T2KPD4_FORAG|nr:AAA family ATPase [Formosa agariphila]CDF80306.1 anticodon nuclease [Formosa agariphila KMM 3901]
MSGLVTRFRDDLKSNDFILLYAYNGTGKTRTSMAFKEKGKKKVKVKLKDNKGKVILDKKGKPKTEDTIVGDTLYFNAFTEDLFVWDNDLQHDTSRVLQMNSDSKFFNGFKELALDEKIFAYLERYATFDFDIDYDNWQIIFKKQIKNPKYNPKNPNNTEPEYSIEPNIKISRGEENIFVWCVFLTICELAIDAEEDSAYSWVKYIYVDDPVSSLDDNNAISVASDLARLLKRAVTKEIEDSGVKRIVEKNEDEKVKVVVSSHHSLFFNVMCNELKRFNHNRYFLHKNSEESHTLQKTDDTPFFHHVAILCELKQATKSGKVNTYHFNSLRSILEKTATFFGLDDFGKCIYGIDKDDVLFERALNLLSHGKYSIYDPVEMGEDNKDLFERILDAFLIKYQFNLPELLKK